MQYFLYWVFIRHLGNYTGIQIKRGSESNKNSNMVTVFCRLIILISITIKELFGMEFN